MSGAVNHGKKEEVILHIPTWIDAQRHFHLTDEQVLMARELGLNPTRLGSIANCKQESFKSPLPVFIEELYFKHFKKTKTGNTRSFSQMVRDGKQKDKPLHQKTDEIQEDR